jgi:hypothetical protein
MTTVPQLEIYKILLGFFEFIKKNDSISSNNPEDSFLNKTFSGLEFANLNYLEQARDLFTRTRNHPKNFDVRMMFDRERAHLPTMHVSMGMDSSDIIGIGQSQGVNEKGQLEYTQVDSFEVNLIFTSDNKNEITIMYELLKSYLPALQLCFESRGLLNVKRSGKDLSIDQSEIPTSIYMRMMTLKGQYESKSPAMEELLNIASEINSEVNKIEIC